MTLPAHDQKHIDDFFSSIASVEGAYKHPVFSFVAIKRANGFVLAQGALQLNIVEPADPPVLFRSENVWAAQYRLADLGIDAKGLIKALLSGSIRTPEGGILFVRENNSYSPYYIPFHEFGLEKQHRLNVLRVAAANPLQNMSMVAIEWELKASATPYETLQELAFACKLGVLRTDRSIVEIVAYNVAAVDFNSKVSGTKALPTVYLAQGLSPEKLRLGYKIQQQGGVTARSSVAGESLDWTTFGGLHHATAELEIPISAILFCVVSYDGIAQQFARLMDPTAVQNARRAALETFDPQLTQLREIIDNQQSKTRGRDFEAAIAWLLWMLGFGVAHLGDTEKTQHAADLIAVSKSGHVAVVECTIGLIKADKLSRLFERTEAVRRSVEASGNRHARVLPLIITLMSRAELAADLERAEKNGIAIFAREDVEGVLFQTRFTENSDQIFLDAETSAAFAREKYNLQQDLPLQP